MQEKGSRYVAQAAIKMAVSLDHSEEKQIKDFYYSDGLLLTAVDFGGEYIASINKIIERAISIAKRDHLIGEQHAEEGSVAGAAREAVTQLMQKALGLNIGGKIVVARYEEHVAVAVFFGIGLMHLNEVSIGLGHRVI